MGQVIDCPQCEGNLPAADKFSGYFSGTATAGCKDISFRLGCCGKVRGAVWILGWEALPGTGQGAFVQSEGCASC